MFPNNFLLRHVKRGTNTIPMLRSILLGLLVLSWSDVVLAASNDGSKTHRATVCYKSGANQEELSIVCPGGYIQIIGAFYGHNSNGCENPTENGECDQTSKIVTTELSTKCNDKLTCSYKPPTIASVNGRKLSGLEIDANPTQCSESRTLELEGRHRPVNEFGAHYKCKEYRICQKLDVSLSGLVMQTENYPELITTNPTCECTYGVEAHGGQFLELTMSCEGQVTVLTEEFDASSKQLTKEEYFCSDDPHFLIGDVKESSRIHFKVDVSRSSEMSAYKIKTDIYRPGGYKLKDGKVSISCVEGSLYLRYSVRLALFIVIPLIVIIIIALIVFRCCLKRRKRRRHAKKRQLKKLLRRAEKERPQHHDGASPIESPVEMKTVGKPLVGPKPHLAPKPQLGLQTAGRQPEARPQPSSPPPQPTIPSRQFNPPSQSYQPPPRSHLVSQQDQPPSHSYVRNEEQRRESIELPVVKPKKPSTTLKDKFLKPKKEKTPKKKLISMERHSPDGSDSEEDLADFARKLHLQNEMKKQEMLDRRAGYRGGSPMGFSRNAHSRSFGTLPTRRRREEVYDSEEEFQQPQRGATLSGTRSASNSRTNLRPKHRPPPPPPPSDLYAPVHRTRHSTVESLDYPPPPIYANPQASYLHDPGAGAPIYATPQIHALKYGDEEMDIQRNKVPLLPPKQSRTSQP